jgi:hypothetical protein
MKNKALIWLAGGVATGLLVWWVLPVYWSSSSDPRSVEYLNKVAADINRSVPVMIDAETDAGV